MNKTFLFPAIFHNAEEGGYWVSFPDLPECFSQGDTQDDAYFNALDALALSIRDRIRFNTIPSPTKFSDLKYDKESFPVIVELDYLDYQRKHNQKAVKKTLSIPSWLNEEANRRGVNFSQILQDALKVELGLE